MFFFDRFFSIAPMLKHLAHNCDSCNKEFNLLEKKCSCGKDAKDMPTALAVLKALRCLFEPQPGAPAITDSVAKYRKKASYKKRKASGGSQSKPYGYEDEVTHEWEKD